MAAFHGCHTHFHTPSLLHTPPPFAHLAQSLGIDFESTCQWLLSLFDPERTPPSFQQPLYRASTFHYPSPAEQSPLPPPLLMPTPPLQTRFASSQYEDPAGVLFKLTQKSSVAQYLTEFEDLTNQIIGLSPPFLLSCFISGLAPEIRNEVQAHQPLTLVQAAGLAKLQEEKLFAACRPPRVRAPPPIPPPLRVTTSTPSTEPQSCATSLPPLLPAPPRQPPPVIKRLTSDEIASRRDCDLCLYYDERYHRGHHCASRVFLLIIEDEDPSSPNIESADPITDPPEPPDPHSAQISLNSLTAHLAPKALRLVELIADHSVVLLVDGGSTHHFTQHQLVAQLGLPYQAMSPL